MIVNFTEQERDYLLEILQVTYKGLLGEISHTDTLDYKELLKEKLAVVDGLKKKVENLTDDFLREKTKSQAG